MGSVYKRGSIWWIKYARNGKPFRESSGSKKKKVAERLLAIREGQIAEGRFPGLRIERVTFDDLAENFVNDYRVNGKKAPERAALSVKNLRGHFGGIRASSITTDIIQSYIIKRQTEGRANATINRELSALKRMFNLGARSTPPKVSSVPHIPHLKEDNVRTGYFEHNEYRALKAALPSHLRPVVTIAYYTGMRLGEIRGLTWSQVDLIEGKITLHPQDTKNRESRIIYMDGELLAAIRFQRSHRDSKFTECPWVFFEGTGKQIGRFPKSWKSACKKADIEGRLFHDLRRTGVRNLVRAGVPERVAMMISGHKTRSVFERYNIVNEDDLKKASRRVTEYHRERAKEEEKKTPGHSLGTMGEDERVLQEGGDNKKPVTH